MSEALGKLGSSFPVEYQYLLELLMRKLRTTYYVSHYIFRLILSQKTTHESSTQQMYSLLFPLKFFSQTFKLTQSQQEAGQSSLCG